MSKFYYAKIYDMIPALAKEFSSSKTYIFQTEEALVNAILRRANNGWFEYWTTYLEEVGTMRFDERGELKVEKINKTLLNSLRKQIENINKTVWEPKRNKWKEAE